jgi:HSP20 family protein
MSAQELQVSEKQEVSPDKGEFTHAGTYFTPPVDIYETEKELVVVMDMPGLTGEDVEVDFKEGALSILGKATTAEEKGETVLEEYRTGNYFRSFKTPDLIDVENIKASMGDGVLTLTLPKSEKAQPKKISITSG